MLIKAANSETIAEAAAILRDGGLVGMPTETVYGLAADATNGEAVARIFEAKGRPAFNPLIIHVEGIEQAGEHVEVSEMARAAALAFWPGPLTMILPRRRQGYGGQVRKASPYIPPASGGERGRGPEPADGGGSEGVSELASAGLETLAVRAPSHKVALDLIKAAGVPLAAPSANKSGSLSPTTPAHVQDSLGDKVDMILAAGACAVGLESTVLDLSGEAPEILRPGAITAEEISEALGTSIHPPPNPLPQGRGGVMGEAKVKSPGQLLKHYAPRARVRLNAIDVKDGEALLAFGSTKFMAGADFPQERLQNLSEAQDLHEAAANLFAMLKSLDESGAGEIAVMAIPEVGIGVAINDRLKRAAQKD